MKLIIVFVIAFMMPFFANAMDWNDYYQLQQNKLLQQQAEYQRQQLEIQQRILDLQQRQYTQSDSRIFLIHSCRALKPAGQFNSKRNGTNKKTG
jgi:hypothetical protein